MFESRREFLQKLLVAATALGVDPLRGVFTSGDQYRNDRLGLTLHRPSGWEFSFVADFPALRERQLLDLVGDEIQPLKDPHNLPVFLIEHPQGPQGMFAPAICLYDEALDTSVPVDQARAHREVMLSGFALSYRDLQPAESVSAQDPMHGRSGHRNLVKTPLLVGDSPGSEMVVLSPIPDLADNGPRRGGRRSLRRAGPLAQPGLAVGGVPLPPLVKRRPRDPEVPARVRHRPGPLGRRRQDSPPPGHEPGLLGLRHRVSTPGALAP